MQNLLLEFKHPLKGKVSGELLLFLTVLLQILFIAPFQASVGAQGFCEQSLGEKIEAIINQPPLHRTRWGIDIQHRAATDKTFVPLYRQNAPQLFLPASAAKLFTTTALVEVFEPSYRIETAYFGQGSAPKLKQLRIVGQGDPSILEPQLRQIAQDLKIQGIQSIETLVGEGSQFGEPQIIPSWEWEDLQTSDGVPITSLSFSQNSLPLELSPSEVGQPLEFAWLEGKPLSPLIIENLSVTVPGDQPEYIRLERNLAGTILTIRGQLRAGASSEVSYVAIANPTHYFLHRLRNTLQSEGIQVKHITLEAPQKLLNDETKLGAIFSPPLEEMLKTINQSSNNFYTESLLRHFATKTTAQAMVSPQESIQTLKGTLATIGIDPDQYFLQDGSGLSRQNLVSPESLTATLKAILEWQRTGQTQKFQTFKNSLAIAGQAGTLKGRFQNSPVAGKLFGKTGTLSGTVTLAGFIEGPAHSKTILSLMANQSDQPIPVLHQAIDQIVLQIAQTQSCDDGEGTKQTNQKKALYNLKS